MWNPLFLIFIIITFSLSIIMIFLGRIISSNNPDLQKNSPYECGFDPINSPRLPFSFRFFLIAILFLIFDLEIALLLILPLITCNNNPITSTPLFIIFLIIISIGLYYEWTQGGLEWAEN